MNEEKVMCVNPVTSAIANGLNIFSTQCSNTTHNGDEWIRKTAGELILSRDPIKEKLGTIIIVQLDNNRTKLYKAVVAVNEENADVVVQKIID